QLDAPPPPPPDAACAADASADPSNCGACGHDCRGGACANGACQPILIGPRPGVVFDLAIDQTSLYYTINAAPPNGAVGRMDVTSGMTNVLSSDVDSPQRIKIFDSQMFFTTFDGQWSLFACDKTMGCSRQTATVIVRSGYIPDFVRAQGKLYFADWDNGNV